MRSMFYVEILVSFYEKPFTRFKETYNLDVTQWSMVEFYRRFGGTYFFHGRRW
jgi:hypothetical protein